MKSILAGNSYTWRLPATSCASDSDWSFGLVVVSASGKHEFTGVVDGEEVVFTLTSAQTKDMDRGPYRAFVFATHTDERRVTLKSWDLTVVPDPTDEAVDMRSDAQRYLSAIEAVLGGSASHDQQTLVVEGDTLVRKRVEDLIRLRDVFRAEVRREKMRRRQPGRWPNGHQQVRLR